jgi:hypothetical protein
MSVAEFSAAMRNRALQDWFNMEKRGGGSASAAAQKKYRADNINNLVNSTSDYRTAEQTAEKTAFIITKETVIELLAELKGMSRNTPEMEQLATKVFARFGKKGEGVKVNRKLIKVGEGVPAVYFSNIAFDSITNLVNAILDLKPNELAKVFEKGHVVGINTKLLEVTAGRISGIDARGSAGTGLPTIQAKDVLLRELTKVIEYYRRLDFDSANIQPAKDVPVYASVNKRVGRAGKTKYLVEIQTKESNQGSAKEVKATIGSIRKLFTPSGLSEAAIKELIDNISASVTDEKFKSDLLNMRSSPSFKDMIVKHILDVIVGRDKVQEFSASNVDIGRLPVPKVDLSNLKKIIKTEKAKVESLKNKLSKSVPKLQTTTPTFSLTSLQNLMNKHLVHVIAANMGSGNAKSVLNYRTGRLAQSAAVENLSISRDGMITAFYSYMKNPYATFSDGGKQQYPKSRDPKLLIAQSIREIAASRVSNKMRAISL